MDWKSPDSSDLDEHDVDDIEYIFDSSAMHRSSPSAGKFQVGQNWKSALCVTSLYDSYLQVMEENKTLKSKLKEVQKRPSKDAQIHPLEKKSGRKECRKPITNASKDTVEQELIESEKEQSEQRLQYLEREVARWKSLYEKEKKKAQDRVDRDPLTAQRQAMSAQSLQHALDEQVHTNQELTLTCERLQFMNERMKETHDERIQELETQLASFQTSQDEMKKANMMAIIQRMANANLYRAFRNWMKHTHVEVGRNAHQDQVQLLQQQLESERHHMRATYIRKLYLDRTKRCLHRYYTAWRSVYKAQRTRKDAIVYMRTKSTKHIRLSAFSHWRVQIENLVNHRNSLLAMVCRLQKYHFRTCYRKWANEVFVRQHMLQSNQQRAEHDEKNKELTSTLDTANQKLLQAHEDLCQYQEEIKRLRQICNKEQEERARHETKVKERLASFFRKNNDAYLLRSTFESWVLSTSQQVQRQVQIRNVAAELNRKKLCLYVRQWHKSTSEKRMKHQVLLHAVTRMRYAIVIRCFQSWKANVENKREKKALVNRVIYRWKKLQILQVFNSWKSHTEVVVSTRRSLDRLVLLFVKMQVGMGWKQWVDVSDEMAKETKDRLRLEQEKERKRELEEIKRSILTLNSYFTMWKGAIRLKATHMKILQKWGVRCNSNLQKTYWRLWKQSISEQKEHRIKLKKWIRRWKVVKLQKAWTQWIVQGMRLENADKVTNVANQYNVRLEELEQSLKQRQEKEVEQQREREMADNTYSAALQVKDRIVSEKDASKRRYAQALMKIFTSKQNGRLVATVFRCWKCFVDENLALKAKVMSFLRQQDTTVVQRIFTQWRTSYQRLRGMKKALGLLHTYIGASYVDRCFSSWKYYIHLEQTIKLFATAFAMTCDQYVLQTTFRQWQTEAHARRVMRSTVQRLLVQSAYLDVQHAFSKWTRVMMEAQREEMVHEKEQRLRLVQEKIVYRWGCRSIRMVFHAWKVYVGVKRRMNQGYILLYNFSSKQLLAAVLIAWKEDHSRRQQIKQVLELRFQIYASGVKSIWFHQWRNTTTFLRTCEITTLRNRNAEQLLTLQNNGRELEQMLMELNHKRADLETHELRKRSDHFLLKRVSASCALIRSFYTWRIIHVRLIFHRNEVKRLMNMNMLKLTRRLYNAWKRFWYDSTKRSRIVEAKYRSACDQCLRSCFSKWLDFIVTTGINRQKTDKLQCRARLRCMRQCFDEWCHSLRQIDRARVIWTKVTTNACHGKLHAAFDKWKDDVETMNRMEKDKEDRQKKLMAYLMDKDEMRLSDVMDRWKSHTNERRNLRLEVNHRYKLHCRTLLQRIWDDWIGYIEREKQQCTGINRTVQIWQRRRERSAWTQWTRVVAFLNKQEMAQQQHDLLAQVDSFSTSLKEKCEQYEQSEAHLKATKERLLEVEQELSHRTKQQEIQDSYATDKFTKMRMVTKLLYLRQDQLSTAKVQAFQKWLSFIRDMSFLERTFGKIINIVRHATTRRGFRTWKFHLLQHAGLEALQRRVKQRQLKRAVKCFRLVWQRHIRLKRLLLSRMIKNGQASLSQVRLHFKLWQTSAALMSKTIEQAIDHNALYSKLDRYKGQLQNLTLNKWCWLAYRRRLGQMKVFFDVLREKQTGKRAVLLAMRQQGERKGTHRYRPSHVQVNGSMLSQEEQHLLTTISHSLGTFFTAIGKSKRLIEVFTYVNSIGSQLFDGCSSVLFLLDTQRNELWAQQTDESILHFASSLGITGHAVSTKFPIFVEDAMHDFRYNPIVDYLVLSQFMKKGMSMSGGLNHHTTSLCSQDTVACIFAVPLLSVNGNPVGVVELAFEVKDKNTNMSDRLQARCVQLVGTITAKYLESLFDGMTRHANDSKLALERNRFTKLFYQCKNWRKYYSAMDRKVARTEDQLQILARSEEELSSSNQKLEKALKDLEKKYQQAHDQKQEAFGRAATCEQEISTLHDKISELQQSIRKHRKELKRREVELTNAVSQNENTDLTRLLWRATDGHTNDADNDRLSRKSHDGEKENSLEAYRLLKADQASLKNKLARVESDSKVLVNAVHVACTHQGELPVSLQQEVDRITKRMTKVSQNSR